MSSRKPIPIKIRKMVYGKYNGHCAYCGCELEYKDMQVDHIKSVWKYDHNKFRKGNDDITEEELHSLDNYMPACRTCNFYKSTFDLETFRDNLSTVLYKNLSKNFNFKLLKKYGLVKENIHRVEFYFEKVGE